MTREEAIKKLQKQKAEYLDEWVDYSGVAEAFDMAIEALKAQEWIPVKWHYITDEEREREGYPKDWAGISIVKCQ